MSTAKSKTASAESLSVLRDGHLYTVEYDGNGFWYVYDTSRRTVGWVQSSSSGSTYHAQTVYGDTVRERSILRAVHRMVGMAGTGR